MRDIEIQAEGVVRVATDRVADLLGGTAKLALNALTHNGLENHTTLALGRMLEAFRHSQTYAPYAAVLGALEMAARSYQSGLTNLELATDNDTSTLPYAMENFATAISRASEILKMVAA